MKIVQTIGKWAEKSMFTYQIFNAYVRFRQRMNAKKNPRELANIDFRRVFHRDINWDSPKNIIEKIFWLQLFTDTTMWSICADKFRIREYANAKGVEKLLPKLYGHWNNSKDIDFDNLPQSFVLKTTNGCGQVLLVPDKSKLNIKKTRELLDRWMLLRYGFSDAQIHYTRIQPCIIAEELLVNSDNEEKGMVDYKVWCLNGKVEYILCAYDRIVLGENRGYQLSAYDRNWNDISKKAIKEEKRGGQTLARPKHLDDMLKYAEKISKDFVVVRVDFYDTPNRIYLGELTFTSGYGSHKEEFYDYLGSKIDLTKIKRIQGINRPDMSKF